MAIDSSLFDKPIAIDRIPFQLDNGNVFDIDILRLDKIHDTISGNKWFKLKHNILASQVQGCHTLLSFGGAYSNHLHALAYAGKLFSLKTIGIVRGEEVENPTLNDCKNWGMELRFVSREDYRKKTEDSFMRKLQMSDSYTFIIPEGGDNNWGVLGCEEILDTLNTDIQQYDLLSCSIGTGTTVAGLAKAFKKEIWGFAPFKNAHSLKEKLTTNLPNLRYIDDYHIGGFGKIKPELEEFMTNFQSQYGIELDRIYTAKMFYGLREELSQLSGIADKKILVVHTGGIQGNRSLH